MASLKYGVILSSAAAGLFYGVLTIFGIIHGVEHYFMAGLLTVVIALVVVYAKQAPIRNGFVSGLVAMLTVAWSQATFLSTYFSNNPGYAEFEMPWDFNPRLYTFLVAPFGALVVGLVVALLSLLLVAISEKLNDRS